MYIPRNWEFGSALANFGISGVGCCPIEMHKHPRSMYSEDSIDVSSVRNWVYCIKSSEKSLVRGTAVVHPAMQ
jgi:hypothetical protein